MISRPSHSALRVNLRFVHSVVALLARLYHNAISLMSVRRSQLAMPPQNVFLCQQLLTVARVVGGDLRCGCAVDSLFAQMVFDLFTTRAGSLQVFLGVAMDFWLSVLSALQFIAQYLQPHCQFGSIDCGHVSLRNEQFVRLETARASVRLLSHVEDYSMGVKLRRGIAINWPSRVVFKRGGDKFARGLRRANIADTCLCVSL